MHTKIAIFVEEVLQGNSLSINQTPDTLFPLLLRNKKVSDQSLHNAGISKLP